MRYLELGLTLVIISMTLFGDGWAKDDRTLTFTVAEPSAREVLRLGPGGCVKGPIVAYGPDGRELLSVPAGASVPLGCQ